MYVFPIVFVPACTCTFFDSKNLLAEVNLNTSFLKGTVPLNDFIWFSQLLWLELRTVAFLAKCNTAFPIDDFFLHLK